MIELHAESRLILGKKTKQIRQNGILPAVLYGEGIETVAVGIPARDFERVYQEAGESTLLRLVVGASGHTVLIHDVAYDPLRGQPIHADFYAVRMDKALRVIVPIVFIGESPAVKNEGGILVKVAQELEVEALPADLPHELSVDLSALIAINSRITVKDLPRGERVRIMAPPEEIVALVEPPRSEEALAELAAAPAAEIKEVKTEREVKAAEKSKEADVEKE